MDKKQRPLAWVGAGAALVLVLALLGYTNMGSSTPASTEEGVYARLPTVDGGSIPVPYAHPDKDDYLAENAAHYTAEAPSVPATAEVGSEAVVPEWDWVSVENEQPIVQQFSNGTGELAAGDTCGIEVGGEITVLEKSGNTLKVAYSAPGSPQGTPCPSGVVFSLEEERFLAMTKAYLALKKNAEDDKALVEKILALNYRGPKEDAGGWHWVDVVNLDPVEQSFSNGYGYLAYGDTCGAGQSDISRGGTIRARGKAGERVLYEYDAKGSPMGTPCPDGVLFWGREL